MKLQKILISSFLTFVLWYLQVIKETSITDGVFINENELGKLILTIDNLLLKFRPFIGGITAILLAIIQINISYLSPRRIKQKLIQRILKELVLTIYENKKSQHRITVYNKSSWPEVILLYIYHTLKNDFLSMFNGEFLRRVWERFPKKSGDYLTIYTRYGDPGQEVKTTMFLIPETPEQIDGIVPYVWFSVQPYSISLPKVSQIEIASYLSNNLPIQRRKVLDKYLEEGKISISKLTSIKRLSMNYYAAPLLDGDQEMWGVIVFENSENTKQFSQASKDRIYNYSRFIQNVISKQGDVL